MKRMMIVLLTLIAVGAVPAAPAAALQTEEVLDLVAMPLAVAAAAEITGVPASSLMSLVESLNAVSTPPAEIVQIVRYSPVLLVDPDLEPQLITLLTNDVDRGATEGTLVAALYDRIRLSGVEIQPLRRGTIEPARIAVIPREVVTRVDEVRRHPHGGPPGQIKKDLGLQTGAEVVHGTSAAERDRVRNVPGPDRDDRAGSPGRGQGQPPNAGEARGNQGHGNSAAKGNQAKGNQGKGNQGKGNQGNGRGKGGDR